MPDQQPDLRPGDRVAMIPQARRIFTWAQPTGTVIRKPRNGRRRRLVLIRGDGELIPQNWNTKIWKKAEAQ